MLAAEPAVVVDAERDAGEEVGALVDGAAPSTQGVAAAGPRASLIRATRSVPGADSRAASPRCRWVFTELREMPERRGDVVDAELVVVAQHEAVALAVGQVAQRVEDLALVVAQDELVLGRRPASASSGRRWRSDTSPRRLWSRARLSTIERR